MIKYASNAFLAMKITYINEIANLCGKVVPMYRTLQKQWAGMDALVPNLHPGPVMGKLFPKDTRALAQIGKNMALPLLWWKQQ